MSKYGILMLKLCSSGVPLGGLIPESRWGDLNRFRFGWPASLLTLRPSAFRDALVLKCLHRSFYSLPELKCLLRY